ncbi:YceI family protein [Nostoc sp. LEGE 12450]|uniref:YceI family protein n=1 Tax=Nostoc sp. LEGE 12450 TaxID=1828643 RepID=UPI00187E6247|nr:YceI family protein [Nostoc sp. LEGE 12450]MBE8986501.1 YceI family protein [Nostoc sp. LEGE 12450]
MAKTTDFTNFGNERPNYFAGQYLLEDDFEIQHKYLSDRQRYHNQSLHISGIIEGLEVAVIQDAKSVQIKSGSAINTSGDLIILKENITFSDFKNITDGVLYIQYAQDKQVQQQKDVPDSYTRWIEKPILGFATTIPENSVKLGKLTIAQNTITLDANVREYSGLSLPNSNSKALTLRSGGNATPNLAVLTGSLKIDGDLTVAGTISGTIDTKNITSGTLNVDRIPNLSTDKITSGTLNVDRIPNLSANKITSGTIVGDLTVNGNVTGKNLSLAADGSKRGALFLAATGDYNHVLYNNLSNIDNEGVWDGAKWNVFNGLNIRVGSGNSKSTAFYLNNNGNVAIGTNNPGDYKLNVQGNQLLKGSLTIQEGRVSLDGSQQIVFSDNGTTNQLKLQLWSGYGLGVNGSTLFYTANGNHSWRDNQNNERMLLSTAVDGGLTVKGTGSSSFAGNLTVTGSLSVGVSVGSTTNIDLSGHVQLKEYGQQNIAFLQARDDSSNRDIGLRIRTQMKGNTQKTLVEAVTITPSGEIQGKIWYSDEYVWNNGQPEVKMGHSSKCVAFLTYVQGKFAGGGEQVFTYIKSDGYWYLGGNQGSAGAGVVAKARCIGSPS